MAGLSNVNLGVIGTIEHAIEGGLPSPLKPYAKALAAALPALLTAYATLQGGHIGVVTVVQFIISVVTVAAVYALPLVKNHAWESGLKTGAAALGAVLSAGAAAFGNGGTQGWFSFGVAVLAAILVEIVDNVPNAAPVVAAIEQAAEGVVAQAPVPSAPTVSMTPGVNITYGTSTSTGTVAPSGTVAQDIASPSARIPLPTVDEVSPEG